MIDTDKYEGHTEGHWTWMGEEVFVDEGPTIARITSDNRADANLIADAPLLLAEVKRLNMVINMLKENDLWVSQEGWEESDKDDELLVSMHFLIDKALELRGDFND
jgi:hypothetical protein|tara:strand:- start:63 stop:380 length:318 start_codon:yes stop_codon:yes gene_type:complete